PRRGGQEHQLAGSVGGLSRRRAAAPGVRPAPVGAPRTRRAFSRGDRLEPVLDRALARLRELAVGTLRRRAGPGVLRRVPAGEIALRRQPLRLRSALPELRGPPRVPAPRPLLGGPGSAAAPRLADPRRGRAG